MSDFAIWQAQLRIDLVQVVIFAAVFALAFACKLVSAAWRSR